MELNQKNLHIRLIARIEYLLGYVSLSVNDIDVFSDDIKQKDVLCYDK